MSLATTYDQPNLVEVSKMEFRSLRKAFECHQYLSITRYSNSIGDNKGWRLYRGTRLTNILMVEHYVPKVPAGTGLDLVYKVDKELLEAHRLQTQKASA